MATPTPELDAFMAKHGLDQDTEAYEFMQALHADAANWRALIGSARIKLMGCAGLHAESPDFLTPYGHIGLEFWTHHEAAGDRQDCEGREWFERYMQKARAKVPA